MTRLSPKRVALIVSVAALAAPAAYAFTASNTVPDTTAGAGTAAVSGYTASGIGYGLDATTPTDVDSVSFTISPAAGTVKVRLSPTGAWYACSNSGGAVTCATTSPQATVDATSELTVVAAQ
jgi:archaellin